MRGFLIFGLAAAIAVACGSSDDSSTSSTGGAGGQAGSDASVGGGAGSSTGGSSTGGGAGTTSGGSAGTTSGGSAGTTSGGSAGTAGSASGGSAGTTGDAGSGKTCGGKIGTPCDSTEWCDFAGTCGAADQTGTCKAKPQNCPDSCPGVCGCNGKFYCNSCDAAADGTDVSKDKSCLPDAAVDDGGVGAACTGDTDCTTGLKCCYPCGIPGCQNLCMVPGKNGQCPLIP